MKESVYVFGASRDSRTIEHLFEEGSPRRILVASSRPGWATELATGLYGWGLLPMLAFDADHVLAYLEADSYDLVVLDISLARTRGASLLEAVHSRTTKPILVVGDLDASFGDLSRFQLPATFPTGATAVNVVTSAAELVGRTDFPTSSSRLRWGPLEIDPRARSATWQSKTLELTYLQLHPVGACAGAGMGCLSSEAGGTGLGPVNAGR